MGQPSEIELPQTFVLKNGRESIIRATVEDDAAELHTMVSQTHTESDGLNYMPGEFDKDEAWERNFIREQLAKPAGVMIVATVDGRIVASGGAGSLEYRRYAHHAEVGLAILKEFWGQGLGRKMMDLLVDWGRRRKLVKMYLKVFEGNDRAIGLYKSMGFKTEATLKDDFLRNDGTLGSTIIMSMYYR